jgi:hypothetical protein
LERALEELETVEAVANRILREHPNPVVRFRLLRDVLMEKPSSEVLVDARAEMLKSCWVRELASEQRQDGSWGRFHSATKSKCKIATTEVATGRGLALGLEASGTIFQAAISYLTCLLEGKVGFPDPAERNNRWATGTQLFVAATLARVCPSLSVLDESWRLWVEIAERTFVSSRYDGEAEVRAHEALTGASVRNSYLVLNNRYQLELLGSRADRLPEALENSLFDWVWHRSDGVGYLGIPLTKPPRKFNAGMLERFFMSLEILSCFPSWRKHARDMVDWLWKQRNNEGLWDFGSRASMTVYFPLSENWRNSKNRQHDWTTRTLTLLRKYYG